MNFELSPQQRRIRAIQEKYQTTYQVECTVDISGPLDRERLQQSLAELVERHQILRTEITETVEGPRQEIREEQYEYRYQDSTEQAIKTPGERQAQPKQNEPFRAELEKEGPSKHALTLTMSAMNMDGEGLDILLAELASQYEDGDQEQEDPVAYVEVSQWLNALAQSEEAKPGRDYWKARKIAPYQNRQLYCSRPRHETEFKPKHHELSAVPGLGARIQAMAEAKDVEPSTVLQLAWMHLLARLTGQEQVMISVRLPGRIDEELAQALGPLNQNVPQQLTVEEHRTVESALDAVEEENQAAAEWEASYSWEQTTEAAHETLPYAIEITEKPERPAPNWTVTRRRTSQEPYELKLKIQNSEEQRMALEYDGHSLTEPEVARIGKQYVTLLEHIQRAPNATLSQLSMMDEAERYYLLTTTNQTQQGGERNTQPHRYLEAMARRQPQRTALRRGEETHNYAELNQRANQLAHKLCASGIGREQRVGVSMNRSSNLIAAIYAIWKVGAVYVPIDPTNPREYRRNIIATAQLAMHLVDGNQAEIEGEKLDLAQETTWQASPTHLPEQDLPESLAYVQHTTGTTGKPKGVAISQHAMMNHHHWIVAQLELSQDERIMQRTPIGFDASLWEIVVPVMLGATMNLIEIEEQEKPAKLIQRINEQQITVMQTVPSQLGQILAEPKYKHIKSLKHIVSGGEALPQAYIQHSQQNPNIKLHNLYGPTETTINVTSWTADKTNPQAEPPIGKPIDNTQLYILDQHMEPVPIGVTGQLYIAGHGLARGYQQQPAHSAQRIVPDPHAQEAGARMYHSGDRARHLVDGNIQWQGRSDRQIKIRGYRIEPAGIEAKLRTQPGIKEAVVEYNHRSGNPRLQIYLEPQHRTSSKAAKIQEIRQALTQQYPDYIATATIEMLTAIPRTPNGKVDRAKLPEPRNEGTARAGYEAPRNPIEAKMAKLWAEVLSVEEVGIRDNFFEMGGDSILVLQVAARARRQGIPLKSQHIFEAMTIAELLKSYKPETSQTRPPETGSIPYYGNAEDHKKEGAPHHYNQAVLLRTPPGLKREDLEKMLQVLAQHHDAFRMRERGDQLEYQEQATMPLQHQRLKGQGAALDEAIEQHATAQQSSIRLDQAPLARAVWYEAENGTDNHFLWVIHHLIIDGVSWRILLDDIETMRRQQEKGEPLELGPRTTSYKAWVQRRTSQASNTGLAWWRRMAGTDPAILPEDRDQQVPPHTHGDTHSTTLELSEAETKAYQATATANRARPEEVLLSAILQTIWSWTKRTQILVMMEGHGREADEEDLTRTIGWFTALWPVALRAHAQPAETLRGVKEQLRNTPGHGQGYGQLRHQQDPIIATLAQPQIVYNYLGQTEQIFGAEDSWQPAKASSGPEIDLGHPRTHQLDVNGIVLEGRLRVTLTGAPNLTHQDLETLAQGIREGLKNLNSMTPAERHATQTPHDYPTATLQKEELQRMQATIPLAEVDLTDLAPLQRGMLYHLLQDPESRDYYEHLTCTLRGPLDVAAYRQAWANVIARHDSLRAYYNWQTGAGLRVVPTAIDLPWRELDWTQKSEQEQERSREQARQQRFEPQTGPMLSLELARIRDNHYQFHMTSHHIIMDGWSTNQVFEEVFESYAASQRGETPQLPPTRPFREYIQWQRRQDTTATQAYWRTQLTEHTEATALPYDKTLSTGEARGYRMAVKTLSSEQLTEVRAMAERTHLTLNTLVRATWAIQQARHAKRNEVTYGVTVSGRPTELEGVEHMVGLFINTVPLRIQLPPEKNTQDWLQDLQKAQVAMEPHVYQPLTQIREACPIPGDKPLYQTILVYENFPAAKALQAGLAGLDIENVKTERQEHFPIALSVHSHEGLTLEMGYDTRYYQPEEIDELLAQNTAILTSLHEHTTEPLASLLGFEEEREAPTQPQQERKTAREIKGPRDPLEHQLLRIWSEILDTVELGIRDNFFEMGGHSLLALRLMATVNAHMGRTLNLPNILQNPTIEEQARYLRQQDTATEPDVLVPLRREGEGTPLILIPGSGGHVMYYYHLVRHLTPGRPVYAMQTPGLDGHSKPKTTVDELVAEYATRLGKAFPGQPLQLGGHSFGSKIALALSARLQAAGNRIDGLVVFDTEAPIYKPIPFAAEWDELDWMMMIVDEIEQLFGIKLGLTRETLAPRTEPERLVQIRAALEAVGWWPPGADEHFLRGLIQVYRASTLMDYQAEEDLIQVPLILFKAKEAVPGQGEEHPAMKAINERRDWGWQTYAKGEVTVHKVPGNHVTLFNEPQVQVTARYLDHFLST